MLNSQNLIQIGEYQFGNYWTTNHCFACGKGERYEKVYIYFQTSFCSSTPLVQCNISGLDANCQKNLRVEVFPTQISSQGFMLNVKTWADSQIYIVKVNWIALQL